MFTVGLCEDDHELRDIVRAGLEREGYTVQSTATGTEAAVTFSRVPPDVLILDIGLPDSDGRDVCQALRAQGVDVPVIFLTARDAVIDRLSGFHAGADDYLTKPFALAELVARVAALARRAAAAAGSPGADGSSTVVLDPATHAIRAAGVDVPLTPTEFRLLAELAAKRDTVVRRSALIGAGWPQGTIVSDNTVDAYISRIRTKLREAGREERIENLRGVGYVLR